MTEKSVQVVEQAADTIGKTAHAVEQTAHVVREVSKEIDWATVRESAAMAGTAVVKFVGWWLCGRGFHIWQTYEYEDGTVVDECLSCHLEAAPTQLAGSTA